MRWAVCRAQAVALAGDRGALAMTFALPAIVFLVFAAIFASASGDELRLKVVLVDDAASPLSTRLAAAIVRDGALRLSVAPSRADAERMVGGGGADAAIVLRRDGRALDTLAGDGAAPVLVITHPARAVAGGIVGGAVQRAYFAALPDAALRGAVTLVDQVVVPLTGEQRATAAAVLDEMAATADEPEDVGAPAFSSLVETVVTASAGAPGSVVTYYAASVAALFVLLAGVPVAVAVHDDLASGAADRALAGPAGMTTLVDGRGLFLVGQGVLQAAVIFAVAGVWLGRTPVGPVWAWLAAALALGVAAAGLTLFVAAVCGTARQATTAATITVLISAAVGGSMVPRFLMPPWLQQAGWLTPNAWAIEAFVAGGRTDGPAVSGLAASAVLVAGGLVGWMLARSRFARLARL